MRTMKKIKETHDSIAVFIICNDKTSLVSSAGGKEVCDMRSSTRKRSYVAIEATVGSAQGADSHLNYSNDHHVDRRSNNRGSAIRNSYTSGEKVNLVAIVSEGMKGEQ